ncbi:TIGR01459 family HAD-type hydrolase [Sphingomonas sp.]|uniref:TIGR01459 family HAD-type hydrolase n=1 Tax=Sphingomonas sp. TaxID=28214 RepID=UPI0017CA65C1|nr:TIGR01459 family HAD-type hydrolase [Sphingomonas sp.]MBA3512370.1 TIGR01459 family HAD-type hydrolase [Sphingomonas sp.]
MNFLDSLDERYRLILCDIWGCVHDGVHLYPGAAERLQQWRGEGRTVVLITNAPRTAEAVEQQLGRMGLPRDAWDGIATSGEAGISALKELGKPVGFLGTAADRTILEARQVEITEAEDFTDLACTGLEEQRPNADQYAQQLADWGARGVLMHCLNPDRLVIRGGVPEACAGAIADVYEALGGRVAWYGKPHKAIYEHALHLAGDPAPAAVLAIGDGLHTDVLGAARMGFDCVFVTGGIHAGEPFPPDFGRQNGLKDWQPVAVVDSLG